MSFSQIQKDRALTKEMAVRDYLKNNIDDCKAYIIEELLKFAGIYSNKLASKRGDVIATIGNRIWRFEVKTQRGDNLSFVSLTGKNNFDGCGYVFVPYNFNENKSLIQYAWFIPNESIKKVFEDKIKSGDKFDRGKSSGDEGYYLNGSQLEMATPFLTFIEQLNERSKMYANKDLKLLSDCERCEYHKGIGEKYVRCGRSNGTITLVITFVANNLEGFTNGDGILYCPINKGIIDEAKTSIS